MVRRIQIEEDDVSLFPFLSIIAAVIGVLTLMIAAVTLGQMNQNDVKDAMANAIATPTGRVTREETRGGACEVE